MPTPPILIRCACLLVCVWLALSSSTTTAQRFPDKTVRIIVGLTPGSAGDSSARFLAGQVFSSHDAGESWLESQLPAGVTDLYAIACGG